MKKIQMVCVIISAAFLGHVLTLQFMPMPMLSDCSIFVINGKAGYYFKKEPPPGWTIVTDGQKFKWVRPSGLLGFSENTKQLAIANAWHQLEYEAEQNRVVWEGTKLKHE